MKEKDEQDHTKFYVLRTEADGRMYQHPLPAVDAAAQGANLGFSLHDIAQATIRCMQDLSRGNMAPFVHDVNDAWGGSSSGGRR